MAKLPEFQMERYYDLWEFSVRHHISPSDCESMSIGELLELAGEPVSTLTDLQLGYTECRGEPDFREAVAGQYEEVGSEDVLVFNAPEEAIFVAMMTLLRPGDRVVVQTPCYQSLIALARHHGCEVIEWALREVDRAEGTDGHWGMDLDELEQLLVADTKMLTARPTLTVLYESRPCSDDRRASGSV